MKPLAPVIQTRHRHRLVADKRVKPSRPIVEAPGDRKQQLENPIGAERHAPHRPCGYFSRDLIYDGIPQTVDRIGKQIDRTLQRRQNF